MSFISNQSNRNNYYLKYSRPRPRYKFQRKIRLLIKTKQLHTFFRTLREKVRIVKFPLNPMKSLKVYKVLFPITINNVKTKLT